MTYDRPTPDEALCGAWRSRSPARYPRQTSCQHVGLEWNLEVPLFSNT